MKMKNFIFFGICFLFVQIGFTQQPVNQRLKAKALMEQEKYDLALDLFKNTTNVQKPDYTIYREMGDCLYFKKEYLLAISNYLKADSLSKNCCSYELARSFAFTGEKKLSLLWLEKHLTGNQKKTELQITTDKAFDELSRTAEWREFWKKSWYTEVETEINAINALLMKGKPNEALSELESYQNQITPKHIYYSLQSKAFDQQNLTEQAIFSINQAIERHPLSDEYLSFRAQLYQKTSNYTEALEDISKAIQMNPLIPSYYLKRAEIARLAGNMKMAESDLKICQELYPESVETYHQLGLFEKARGNHLTALAYYDKVLEKDVTRSSYFLERGVLAFEVKQIEKADGDFGMALDLDPRFAEAYLQKGNTRLILQDKDGACYCWKKAKQFGNSEAAKLIYQNCKE
jgi:tetratricopeptide (TPR) repeat protein